MSTELGTLGRVAAFSLAAAGIVAAVAGAQISSMVIFRDAFTGALPLVEVGLGITSIFLAIKLSHPRGWARVAGVAVVSVLLCGGMPWTAWLAYSGLFTALAVLSPMLAFLSLVLLAASWREVGTVARVRAAAEAETAVLMAQAMGGTTSPPERAWLLPVIYGLVAIPAGLFAIALLAPETWTWGEVRVRGMMVGRSPFGSSFVERATAYPYAGSPLEWYLDYEDRWVDLPKEDVLAVADRIAENTAWRLAAATGSPDPVEGERRLWADGRAKELPLWIAEELRGLNAFYSPESLFSRSFDPEVHTVPDTIHMDCDQLVYLYLHVAMRLDLAMSAVPSPMHVYLRYAGPSREPPIWVETTQFRHIDINGQRVDFMGAGIGEDYFIDEQYYPSGRGGTWASSEITIAAGYYTPWTDRDIEDTIVANVMLGAKRAGVDVPYAQELEAHLAGTREVTLATNLYLHYLQAAEQALAAGKRDEARASALEARRVRASHGALVLYIDASEERILVEVGE